MFEPTECHLTNFELELICEQLELRDYQEEQEIMEEYND